MNVSAYELQLIDTVRTIRQFKNYSQEFCAAELQITQASYGRIESGKVTISIWGLKRLCKAFNITLPELIDLAENHGQRDINIILYKKYFCGENPEGFI